MGGTCHMSPKKEAAAFFMSSSLMCSQGSLCITLWKTGSTHNLKPDKQKQGKK